MRNRFPFCPTDNPRKKQNNRRTSSGHQTCTRKRLECRQGTQKRFGFPLCLMLCLKFCRAPFLTASRHISATRARSRAQEGHTQFSATARHRSLVKQRIGTLWRRSANAAPTTCEDTAGVSRVSPQAPQVTSDSSTCRPRTHHRRVLCPK